MFFKITILAVLLAGSVQCLEYPPGVSPKECPNYPYCGQGYIPDTYPTAYAYPGNYYSNGYAYPSGYAYPRPYAYPSGYAYPNGYAYGYPSIYDYLRPYAYSIAPQADQKMTEVSMESAAPTLEPADVTAAPMMEAPRAPEYPADVDPASCPNYPFCSS